MERLRILASMSDAGGGDVGSSLLNNLVLTN